MIVWKHAFDFDIDQRNLSKTSNYVTIDKNQLRNLTGNDEQNLSFFKNVKVNNVSGQTLDLRKKISKKHVQSNKTLLDDSKVVFFLGGGKSGSTALATYLKHDPNNWKVWDANGQFMDGGKEFCWAMKRSSKEQFWKHFTTHGSTKAIFALDACPQATERTHFERMVKTFPNASYLMLVRDPVDRAISHMNDEMDKKDKTNTIRGDIESRLRGLSGTSLAGRLSMFGKILLNAYTVLPRGKIMIVPTQDMTKQPQETINRILNHIGAGPKNVSLVEANKRKHWKSYQIPSNTTIKRLRDIFHDDWELFKKISGIHIDTVYMNE